MGQLKIKNKSTKKYSFIYQAKCIKNNKSYVGLKMDCTLEKRKKQHEKWAFDVNEDGEYESAKYFHRAIRKRGKKAFEWTILQRCYGGKNLWKNLCRAERYWIAKLKAHGPRGYNETDGGEGMGGYKHTKEWIKNHSGKNNGMYGVHRYEKDAPMYHKHHTKEARKKISETRVLKGIAKGKNNGMYGVHRYGKDAPMYGVHRYGKDAPSYGLHRYGKDAPFWHKHHKKKSKEIIRKKTKKRLKDPRNNPMYHHVYTEETRKKMKKSAKGKHGGDKNGMFKNKKAAKKVSIKAIKRFEDPRNRPMLGRRKINGVWYKKVGNKMVKI